MLTRSSRMQLGTPSSKVCRTCRATKPLGEFARHLNGRDGRRAHCRECCLAGRKQPKRETEAQRARRAVRDAARREGHRAEARRHARRYPAVMAAGRGLHAAIRAGQVRKPKTCQAQGCRSSRLVQAHHFSYAPEHWLSVLWLCFACHRKCHAVGYIQPKAGIAAERGLAPDLEPLPLTEAA
jgi:hypothetical protein